MLGTSTQYTTFKNADDFTCSADYLNYMYSNIDGLIARSSIREYYSESFNRSKVLLSRKYDGMSNIYTSMNSFFKPNRESENVKRLNALYVDLDCYKLGLSKESVLYDLYENYFDTLFPVPTFIIDSGRGLYLIWKINEDRNALPRWNKVMNYIIDTFKPLGADCVCKDTSRILRVPFTYNSKSNTTVTIIDFFDKQYTLHELIREYDIKNIKKSKSLNQNTWSKPTGKMIKYAKVLAEQNGQDLPNLESYEDTFSFIAKFKDSTKPVSKKSNVIYFNTNNLKPVLLGRCKDIEILFSIRKNDNRRELGLFLYRMWLCEATGDFSYALEQTLLLNSNMAYPHEEKYVIERTKSAEKIVEKGKSYKYKLADIVNDLLEITDDEMNHLQYLTTSPSTHKERRKKNNRKAYLNKLEKEGKQTKAKDILERRKSIAILIVKGMDKKAICVKLEVSTRTYERDVKYINDNNMIEEVKDSISKVKSKSKNIGVAQSLQKVETPLFDVATNIKYTYYKRTHVVSSAGDFDSRQLSFSDILKVDSS